jgi:arginase family enzyme
MRTPHFFKAKSRLGTHKPPYRQKLINFGVEEAPDFILNESFLEKFKNSKVDNFDFPLPENLREEDLIHSIANYYGDMKKNIIHLLKEDEAQIVVGGDDSVTLPSILAALELLGNDKLGYIRFDSHADMNLYSRSPTKNFHGMYMRPLYGKFDVPSINNLVGLKIKPENSVFIGNLDLDEEEEEFFKKTNIRSINKEDLKKHDAINFLNKLIGTMNHIHVSIDIDAFDKSEAPATGIPAEGGLTKDDVLPLFQIIKEAKNLSLDLVEVNPLKPGAGKTIVLARTILQTTLT